MTAGLVFGILLLLLPSIILGWGGYYNWITDMAYQREIGIYFKYADRASDASTKSEYFNQYVDAIEKEGLTEGCTSIFYCEQPNAQLKDNYKALKSLQTRLNELKQLDEKETAYQLGMTQMTENEFCWFPIEPFRQAYMLRNGAWGDSITPDGVSNMCASN